MANTINIKNKKAFFEFEILEKFIAGIQLMGSEIKSIRESKASIKEGFCFIKRGELWIKNMHINEYAPAVHYGHEPIRERKLLVTKKELKKLETKIKEKGLAIIPLRLFISKRGFAKLEIALAKGKKIYDKRESIKAKEIKRDLKRIIKMRKQ